MKLLATLGWNPDVVSYAISVLNPEKVVVFYGSREDSRIMSSLNAVKEEYGKLLTAVEVDPLSLSDCIKKIRPHISDDSVANITGGTKIMSFTLALLSVYREAGEIPVIYVTTRNKIMRVNRIPLVIDEMRIRFKKNNTNYLILKILLEDGDEMAGPEVRSIMRDQFGKKVSDSTFNTAKNDLVRWNLIEAKKQGRVLKLRAKSNAWFFVGEAMSRNPALGGFEGSNMYYEGGNSK